MFKNNFFSIEWGKVCFQHCIPGLQWVGWGTQGWLHFQTKQREELLSHSEAKNKVLHSTTSWSLWSIHSSYTHTYHIHYWDMLMVGASNSLALKAFAAPNLFFFVVCDDKSSKIWNIICLIFINKLLDNNLYSVLFFFLSIKDD